MSENTSGNTKPELQAKMAAANKRGQLLMFVWGVSLLVAIAAWVLFHYELQSVACYFRDNSFLRDIWPPNATALLQMPSLHYSERDQCTFFGVRSITSLTLLVGFIILFAWTGKELRSFRIKKFPLIFPALLIGFAIFFMWLDKFDDYHGLHASFGFHPNDSIDAAIIKSLLRIYFYYWLLFCSLLSLILYFPPKPASKSPSPTS
ncbi:hypothetical protein [Rhizobium hainanense]|uniref:Uncharacterized protein n=1 Tax=Rhizobium hainanense TaxID=52131 RepID=A0A1C3WH29_9HYPH|nr:hypothetical protein [Rhizobium hainanense]SCB39357.1 hypothetical protein GA0061100_11938 [Rhizobium hainanense]